MDLSKVVAKIQILLEQKGRSTSWSSLQATRLVIRFHIQHHWGSTFHYPLIIDAPFKGGGKDTELIEAEGTNNPREDASMLHYQFLVLPSKWVKCQYESHWKLRQFIQNDEGNPLRAELPALGQEALHPLQGCQAGQIAWGFHQSQGWSTWWCGWRNCWDRQWIHRILSIEVKNWIFKILASSITSFWS